jgi:hypothetical protein
MSKYFALLRYSSKNSIQEAKRLYTEMQERRSDYEPIDLMFDKSSYKAKTAVSTVHISLTSKHIVVRTILKVVSRNAGVMVNVIT